MQRIRTFLGKLKRAIGGFFTDVFEGTSTPGEDMKSFQVGRSAHGSPLSVYKVGQGQKNILFVGGIHGNEVGTVKLMHKFLAWLDETPEAAEGYKIWVLPCLNPDGFALAKQKPDYWDDGRIGRFNGNGVDLNRNFPVKSWRAQSHWTHGYNYSQRIPVHCGSGPGSEPEIQALTDFIKKHKIQVLYVFHNKARDVMGSRDKIAQELSKHYAAQTRFKCFAEEDWKKLEQTGTAKEWCEENSVSYIEVEGSTRYGSDWKRQAGALKSQLELLRS